MWTISNRIGALQAVAVAGALCASLGLAPGQCIREAGDTAIGLDDAWPEHRSVWQVNDFTASQQGQAAIDIDARGRISVVWASRRQNQGRSAVCIKRFDAQGRPLGQSGETMLSLWSPSHRFAPVVDSGASSVLWTAWESFGQDGDAGAIIARWFAIDDTFSALETSGSSELLVNQVEQGHQGSPRIAVAADGRALIVWTSHGAPGEQAATVRARLFAADGLPFGDEVIVDQGSPGPQRTPAVAKLSDEGFVVAWGQCDSEGRPSGLRLRCLNEHGQPVAAAIDLATAGVSASAIEPAVAALGNDVVVTWVQPQTDLLDFDVQAVVLDQFFAPTCPAFIAHDCEVGTQNAPAIVCWPADGRFAILINSRHQPEGSAPDQAVLVGAMFDRTGRRIDTPGERLADPRQGQQRMHEATASVRAEAAPDGSVVVAWDGDAGGALQRAGIDSPQPDQNGVYLTMLSRGPVDSTVVAGPEAAHIAALDVDHGLPHGAGAGVGRGAVEGDGPEPHIPPSFDPRRVAEVEREMVAGLVDIGFTGIVDTGWNPPDPHLATGPNHLVGMTNGAIAFFSKSGMLQFQDQIEGAGGFWGALGATGFVFDPEVLFDESSGRFFAMASERVTTGGPSFVLIAVSDDSDPNGTWHKYRLNTTSLGGHTFDSPNIAVDQAAVYITGDGLQFNNYPVFVLNKAPMLSGQPVSFAQSVAMPTFTQSAGIPPMCLADPPTLYMVEHSEQVNATMVRLIALTNGLTMPQFASVMVNVPAYGPPENPPQLGSSTRPITFDARFWSVAYRNGSLWATHHGGSRVLVRWYQFATNGWPHSGQLPTLVQSGIIDPGPTVRTFFSAISANDDGDAALVFARSSPTEFISMCTAIRHHNDPLGTFQPPVTRRTSTEPSDIRWGDYAGMGHDPESPGTFWSMHEYKEAGFWRTWIQSTFVAMPPPGNDLCANAILAPAGSIPFTTIDAQTDGPDEPLLCSNGGFTQITNDVWYRFPAQCTGTATISLCGADYDARLAVYASSCPPMPGLALACSDDFCGEAPQVSFAVEFGSLYRVRIGGTNGATGTGTMVITCKPAVACLPDIAPPGGNGAVDVDDLLAVINAWGACADPDNCPADIAPAGPPIGDDMVNVDDLLAIINGWGDCP